MNRVVHHMLLLFVAGLSGELALVFSDLPPIASYFVAGSAGYTAVTFVELGLHLMGVKCK